MPGRPTNSGSSSSNKSIAIQVSPTGIFNKSHQSLKPRSRSRNSNPISREYEWPLRPLQAIQYITELRNRIVRRGRRQFDNIKPSQGILINGRGLNVDRNVDPNWAWPSGSSQVRRFFKMVANAL